MIKKSLLLFALFSLIACGGGSGESEDDPASPSVSIASKSLNLDALNTRSTEKLIKITIENIPEDGLYVGAESSNNVSIESVSIIETSMDTADLVIKFPPGSTLSEGIHTNTIEALFCIDENCNQQISGSPIIVSTNFTVEFGSVSVDSTSFEAQTSKFDSTTPFPENFSVKLEGEKEKLEDFNFYISNIYDITTAEFYRGIYDLIYTNTDDTINASFKYSSASFPNMLPGLLKDTIGIQICYDSACKYHVPGSPLTVTSKYTITLDPADGNPPVPITNRHSLDHNIVDAEYSKALDSIVIVSSWPENALYVYNTNNNSSSKIALNFPPKAVSINNSNSGKRFAIGHDKKITVIDYDENTPASSVVKVLNSSTDIFDLVLEGDAIYSIKDEIGDISRLTKIDILNNTEVTHEGRVLFANSKVKLHPSGQYVYVEDFDDIYKIDITGSTPSFLYDSIYHADYPMDSNLWISDDGESIYTGRGNTFSASALEAQDLRHSGTLAISTDSSGYSLAINSLSDSTTANEIAAIENSTDLCDEESLGNPCYSGLRLYTKDFYSETAVYGFAPVNIGNKQYLESGKFIFYNQGGNRVFVLSTLLGTSTPSNYLLEVTR